MNTMSEQLLCVLEEKASLLKKAQVNLKKCPKQRLTKGKVIEVYIDLDLEEVAVNEINNRSVYLPHHVVIKESSETTKVQVVYDASALDTNNVSLSKDILLGPTLLVQDDIRSLVMRWRLRRVAYVADIKKRFCQILVSKEDANYQRIMWRREENGPIKDYRL
ncbi:unnamed protein product [Arctia plantaginis]|uniref:Uncharacterized protein n=1 Tax=Arctia plantaginis TaxID=874455 RepID=A0A8S0ZN86_ARCPL|nr:unnamed protein product [Arctia plantaginis]